MKVKTLSVGPIVGVTTPTSTRIWGRGDFDATSTAIRRCFGVARLKKRSDAQFGQAVFFKMQAEFDYTGIADFKNLQPGESYEYEIGYFYADSELKNVAAMELEWPAEVSRGQVKTVPASLSAPISFVFGSCRYLLRFLGRSLFDDRGDKTFRSILQQIQAGSKTDLLLMCGDQIYADDLNFLSRDRYLSEYHERYAEVFAQPYIRQLMSMVPTYMTLDDHEIKNDWSQDEFKNDAQRFANAMHAYHSYQVVHGPAFQFTPDPTMSDIPEKIWYTQRHGCAEFFVLDSRTERFTQLKPPRIISQEQMDGLKRWLTAEKNSIKFIVSSVPFFPDAAIGNQDRWAGFREQRRELLDFIRENKIQRVVFLSGDVHTSGTAQLVCPSSPNFRLTSLISSPFYWPYPHLKRSNFITEGVLERSKGIEYVLDKVGNFYGVDNFTRVTASLDSGLKVDIYGRKGALLESISLSF